MSGCPHVGVVIFSINYHKEGLSVKNICSEGETGSLGLAGCLKGIR